MNADNNSSEVLIRVSIHALLFSASCNKQVSAKVFPCNFHKKYAYLQVTFFAKYVALLVENIECDKMKILFLFARWKVKR